MYGRKDIFMSHDTSTMQRFTSESVAAGHPDKIADQISDAILDAVLASDPMGRTAVETLVGANHIVLAGEINTTADIDVEAIVREQIRRLGYTHPAWGFSDQSPIANYLHKQSFEIAVGVERDGAGDQGIMFGYATNETCEYLPLPLAISHALVRALDEARESGVLPFLRPDGKAQVVVLYEHGKPIYIKHVTIAVPHSEDLSLLQVKNEVFEKIIVPVVGRYGFEVAKSQIIINGTGVWHHPGPHSDAGLTGRKIVVDSYGGCARVGGGAFSGKDPSKVDRSGAYAARYIAKNIVSNGFADKAEVSLAYYIGGKKPVQFEVDTFGTNRQPLDAIVAYAHALLEPSVATIIETLRLRQPIYLQTAAYGHFGKEGLPWEEIVPLK